MESLASGMIVLVILAAIVQVISSYSLQVLAEKNELPEFASFLAWIPLLNLYPMIRAGGGDFKKFALGSIGAIVLVGIATAIGLSMEMPIIAGLAGAGLCIVAVVYMARIAMETAARRGLVKWLGLLIFVPIANFFIYPYIAFHDGFLPPNKVGVILGLLLAFGPVPGQIQMLGAMQEMTAQHGDGTGEGGMSPSIADILGQASSTMQIAADLGALEGLDPSDPAQADQMKSQLAGLRRQIAQAETQLGPDGVSELQKALRKQEARLGGAPPEMMIPGSIGGIVAETTVGDRTGRGLARNAAPPALTDALGRDGDRGFAVPDSPACPYGTSQRGAAPPDGFRQWCERIGQDAGIKHGWMTEWHPNRKMSLAGEYRDGMRVGVWTRWHGSGAKRVQAKFDNGMQDGLLIAWDDTGIKVHENSFSQGAPASR